MSPDCNSYVGTSIESRSFDKIWQTLPSVPTQRDYESDANYRNRVGAQEPKPAVWIRRNRTKKESIGFFNRRTGLLEISSSHLSFHATSAFAYELNLPNAYKAFAFVATEYDLIEGKPYVASNAMGAKTTVRVATELIDLVVASGDNEQGREWDFSSEVEKQWKIAGSPEQLRDVSENGNYVWLVKPENKVAENLRQQTNFASFSSPIDVAVIAKRVMTADFLCAGLIDGKGVVLRAAPIRFTRF
jgi:hypothetical protein